MTLKDGSGNTLSQSALQALTAVTTPPVVRTFNAPVMEKYDHPGTVGQKYERIKYRAGQSVFQSELDGQFNLGTVTSVSPNNGLAAGGTKVTLTGTNLYGVSNVSFGGTYGTALKVVSDTQVTVTTPSHAAGKVDVVVTDDGGQITVTQGYTYN